MRGKQQNPFNTPQNGAVIRSLLREAGIDAQKVVRRRKTGYYTADFFVPGMQESVPSSKVWAETLERRFPGRVKIIKRDDTQAPWRPGKPTIHASVTFALDD